jgi:hypothetical protein
MRKIVHFALAALLLTAAAAAQNLPAIDVFGGYSYFRFDQPTSTLTTFQQLQMNGWEFSASVGLFHHFSVEGDLSGHTVGDCAGSGVNCSNFSYMFGPRFTLGDRSSKITPFVHALVGQDRADLLGFNTSTTVSDTSVAFAAGGGVDVWIFRHVGLQFGPVDYVYTNHLSDNEGTSQASFRASGGIAFRFGGNFPPPEPKAPKAAKSESDCHRSKLRPWHKTCAAPAEGEPAEGQPSESQPSAGKAHRQAPPPSAPVASHGMPIHSLGVTAAPQEFDGAKILQIEPGSVAEMASLHVGDLITSIDGKAVRTPMELAAEMSNKTGKVRIGIVRGKVVTETVIILGAQ